MAAWPYSWPWPKVRTRILNRDKHECQLRLPGCTFNATDVDHIVPWRQGGAPYDPANLRAACSHCNNARRTKPNPPNRDAYRQW